MWQTFGCAKFLGEADGFFPLCYSGMQNDRSMFQQPVTPILHSSKRIIFREVEVETFGQAIASLTELSGEESPNTAGHGAPRHPDRVEAGVSGATSPGNG